MINADLLNIRGGPSTNDEIVRTANQGDRFTITERSADGTWVQIAENGQPVGWVTEFVTISAEANSDTPTASGPTPSGATKCPGDDGAGPLQRGA